MRIQVDIRKDGKVVYEVLQRDQGENCTKVSHQLVQGMSIESDERTGPDCEEVYESIGEGNV